VERLAFVDKLESTRHHRRRLQPACDGTGVEAEGPTERERGGGVAGVVGTREPRLDLDGPARGADPGAARVESPGAALEGEVGLGSCSEAHHAPAALLHLAGED